MTTHVLHGYFHLKLNHKLLKLLSFSKFKPKKQLGKKIKSLQTDGGGEFQAFTIFLKEHGIIHRLSCPHTHHQNGRVERKHRHIVETGLTLLAQAGMPLTFWWDAFQTSVYLINRMPTSILENKSPFQILYNKILDYSFLKVFGCAVFPHLRDYNKHKLDFRSDKCIFLGYSTAHKGYKCLHKLGKVFVMQHVVFNEYDFPFKSDPSFKISKSYPNHDSSTLV